MRILESAPRRYDFAIRLLTLGGLDGAYDRLASFIGHGDRVLDLGCGTGALTLRAAGNGARVNGIDINAGMLEVAQERARHAGLADKVQLREMGIAELDGEPSGGYDTVTSGLCFSELSEDEIGFALAEVTRLLRPGGLLIVVDEVRPSSFAARLVLSLVRAPLSAITRLVVGETTRPVENLPEKVGNAGLSIESVRTSRMGTLLELVARKPLVS